MGRSWDLDPPGQLWTPEVGLLDHVWRPHLALTHLLSVRGCWKWVKKGVKMGSALGVEML